MREDLSRSRLAGATRGCDDASVWLKMATLNHGRWFVEGGSDMHDLSTKFTGGRRSRVGKAHEKSPTDMTQLSVPRRMR
jgi:hypothetical protein